MRKKYNWDGEILFRLPRKLKKKLKKNGSEPKNVKLKYVRLHCLENYMRNRRFYIVGVGIQYKNKSGAPNSWSITNKQSYNKNNKKYRLEDQLFLEQLNNE